MKKVKQLFLNSLIFLVLASSLSSTSLKEEQESKLFKLEREHPAFRLDGCNVKHHSDDRLSFEVKKPGHSFVILRASAPLEIVRQSGVKAKMRPGWDGTLGYSLYSLEIDNSKVGTGEITLSVVPVPSGSAQSQAELNARNSRFPDSREAFDEWQEEWRKKLMSQLMNGQLTEHVPLSAEVLYIENRPSFTLRRVAYQLGPDDKNVLLLSLPVSTSGRVPLLVALHGHESPWGDADSAAFRQGHADDFCAYFASRGWAVLQPATMNHNLRNPGWTLQGEWTRDAMAALDYALSLPEIDPEKVMVCGLSTGGHLAMNMLALDRRVKGGVVGCVFSTWHHYKERMRIPPHCDCGIYSQLGNWLEQCDWAALAAPKPVQFQHGRKDAGFCPGADPALLNLSWNTAVMPVEEFSSAFAEVKRAYRLTGSENRLELFFHDEGHKVNNEAAFRFLESVFTR